MVGGSWGIKPNKAMDVLEIQAETVLALQKLRKKHHVVWRCTMCLWRCHQD